MAKRANTHCKASTTKQANTHGKASESSGNPVSAALKFNVSIVIVGVVKDKIIQAINRGT